MWTYHPALLERPVPRYTSYPTAAEFTDSVDGTDLERSIAAMADGTSLSLYVHIPYCQEICWYCGCNTGAANKARRLSAYLEALEQEIVLIGQKIGTRGIVRSIAFGGGSPNAIAPVDFVRLLQHVEMFFRSERPEISVELDPRTLTDPWLEVLGAAGIGRASLGVQTFAPHVQQAIGRVQDAALIERSVAGLRAAGIGSVNFDLMYGLPDQSIDDLSDTLARAIALRPDRIALFGYAHVPDLLPRQRRITGALPDQATRFAMAELGHGILTQAGYRAIGFDHFALPGDSMAIAAEQGRLRRNFQGFTADPAPVLIGLGATAISSFPDAILQNEKNPGRYRMRMSAGQIATAKGVLRNAEDRIRGDVIEALLCAGAADVPERIMTPTLWQALDGFRAHGLLRMDGNRVVLEPGAAPYARTIAAQFDSYRSPAARQFSNAV